MRETLSRNGFSHAHALKLDFTRDSIDQEFDSILGAEIVYDPAAYAPLADFVDRHLAPGGVFLVTDAFRGDAVRFFDDLRRRGFRGERRAVREWEDGRWQGAFLWSFGGEMARHPARSRAARSWGGVVILELGVRVALSLDRNFLDETLVRGRRASGGEVTLLDMIRTHPRRSGRLRARPG